MPLLIRRAVVAKVHVDLVTAEERKQTLTRGNKETKVRTEVREKGILGSHEPHPA